MKNLFTKPRWIGLMMLVLLSLKSYTQNKECPSRAEVEQSFTAAISILDESNATENEIKAKLESIIKNEIQGKDLIRIWVLIETDLGGGDLKKVHPNLKAAAYTAGNLNKPDCIGNYNGTLEKERDPDNSKPPKKEEPKNLPDSIPEASLIDNSLDSTTVAKLFSPLKESIAKASEAQNIFNWIHLVLLLLLIGLVIYLILSLLKHRRHTDGGFGNVLSKLEWLGAQVGVEQKQQEVLEDANQKHAEAIKHLQTSLASLSKAMTTNTNALMERLDKLGSHDLHVPASGTSKGAGKPEKQPKVTQVLYANYPQDEYFGNLFSRINQDVAYKIEVLEGSDKARYAPVIEPAHMRRAISDEHVVLASGCMYRNGRPKPGQSTIVVASQGTLIKSGAGWKIQERAEISFSQ